MSGGSYNYLFQASGREVVDRTYDLERMFLRLVNLGYAEEAVKEVEDLIILIRRFETSADAAMLRLRPVLKAVEWRDSMDIGDDELRKEIEEWKAR